LKSAEQNSSSLCYCYSFYHDNYDITYVYCQLCSTGTNVNEKILL